MSIKGYAEAIKYNVINMLNLKVRYFGHVMRRTDSLQKTLMLGKIEEEKGIIEDEIVGWHH